MSNVIITDNEIKIIDSVMSFHFNGSTLIAQENCDYHFTEDLNKDEVKQIIDKLTEWHDKM